MSCRQTILGTAAAICLLLSAAALEPEPFFPPAKAQAATNPDTLISNALTLSSVDYDQTGNISFGGRGSPGSKVQLYVDNNAYGLAFINEKGTWTYSNLSPLTVGPHTLRANEIDGNGAVKSRIEMPFFREEPAKIARARIVPLTAEPPKPYVVTTNEEALQAKTQVGPKKKKESISTDQPSVYKSVKLPADVTAARSEDKKNLKKVAALPENKPLEKSMNATAGEPVAPIENNKKQKAKPLANIRPQALAPCDPGTASCQPAPIPTEIKKQGIKRNSGKGELVDAGAESWRINCSSRFGGFNKSSDTFISSAGKRVSCIKRPKNARGNSKIILY